MLPCLPPCSWHCARGSKIYLAEGVHHRFDLFPAMAETEALEGTVHSGDIIFVPCMGVS